MKRSEQRAGDGRVRVRVTAEGNNVPKAVLDGEALGGHLQPDAGGEQRVSHVRPVDASSSPGLGDQVLELLSSLPIERDSHGAIDRLTGTFAPHERRGDERHRQAGRPASLVPVGDRRERRRLLQEQLRTPRSEGSERRAVHHRAIAGGDFRSALLP
jgi:hypothetical protein